MSNLQGFRMGKGVKRLTLLTLALLVALIIPHLIRETVWYVFDYRRIGIR